MDLKILYEDEDILAIDKPAGLVVHSDGRTDEPNVVRWFVSKYPNSKDVGENVELQSGEESETLIERSGVVHRIDRETSGVLLLAKSDKGFKYLKRQFKDREISKTYHLFVHGLVKQDHGSINLPIGRSASDFRKWSAERGARGEKREALTYYRVLQRVSDSNATFVEAKPKTGRTHQIRVHFNALHHPVVGDKLYASSKSSLFNFHRLALHARGIKFKNTSGEEISVESPYPEDFKRAIEACKE